MTAPNIFKSFYGALLAKATAGEFRFIERTANGKFRVKQSFAASQVDQIAAQAQQCRDSDYIKINLFSPGASAGKIGGKGDLTQIVCVSLDIDVSAKSDVYGDRIAVQTGLSRLSVPPSILVESNGSLGGFHAYWLLETAVDVDSLTINVYQQIAKRLHQHVHEQIGCPVDATAGLERLLRPPGATRSSGERVQPVWVRDDIRYSFDQLASLPVTNCNTIIHSVPKPKRRDESAIEKYLQHFGYSTIESLLSKYQWTEDPNRPDWYFRPGAASGAHSGQIWEVDGVRGLTIKTAGPIDTQVPDPIRGGLKTFQGQGEWYSPTRLFVQMEHDGNWHSCAGDCREKLASDGILLSSNVAWDDPERLARELLADEHLEEDGLLLLRHYKGKFYKWTGAAYAPEDSNDVGALVTNYCNSRTKEHRSLSTLELNRRESSGEKITKAEKSAVRKMRVTRTMRDGVLTQLEAIGNLPANRTIPSYIDAPEENARDLIFAANGIYDPSEDLFRSADPKVFNTTTLAVDYDKNATCPKWEQFLAQILPVDQIELLRVWFGLNLIRDTSYQKILCLIGPPRSGKGLICSALSGLLGDLASATSFHDLAGQFGLQVLEGKLALINPEDKSQLPREKTSELLEKLLKIGGGDKLEVARKHKEAVQVQSDIRVTYATNEVRPVPDNSGALLARTIFVETKKSFEGKEDPKLKQRILSELPGILNWSLVGLRLLQVLGDDAHEALRQPKSSEQVRERNRSITNPIRTFVDEYCDVGAGHEVKESELFKAVRGWFDSIDRKPPTQTKIQELIRANFPGVDFIRRNSGKVRTRVCTGLRLDDKAVGEIAEMKFVPNGGSQMLGPKLDQAWTKPGPNDRQDAANAALISFSSAAYRGRRGL